MAGVKVVHGLPGGRHLIPKEKTGLDFLLSSHFRVAQSDEPLEKTYYTITTQDYVPWGVDQRAPPIKKGQNAPVIGEDTRFFNQRATEMQVEFKYRPTTLPPPTDSYKALSATNFKMHADQSKFNGYLTSQNIDFPSKDSAGTSFKMKSAKDLWKSHVPQGDPDKEKMPASDYVHNFKPIDVEANRAERAAALQYGGPNPIKGDNRTQTYSTSHNDTFLGQTAPRLPALEPPTGSNVPVGDPGKEMDRRTTFQAAYTRQDNSDYRPFDRVGAATDIRKTHFVLDDGLNDWNQSRSTFVDSYTMSQQKALPVIPRENARNKSDMPPGDIDPYRNGERASLTTARASYGKAHKSSNQIVSGADKGTKSDVLFGEPRLAGRYYTTTNGHVYTPQDLPAQADCINLTHKSDIPVHYYDNDYDPNSIYRTHFHDPEQPQLIPNPQAIEKLRATHIKPQLRTQELSTEHQERYKVPGLAELPVVDAYRLQRSHVPLGSNVP
ncbi:hypothetical protein LSAT2_006689 [Lamellibrachia satsuma]|nr:hypothetical protein LSAT2_006689 [Lamellibrachia satsuma]